MIRLPIQGYEHRDWGLNKLAMPYTPKSDDDDDDNELPHPTAILNKNEISSHVVNFLSTFTTICHQGPKSTGFLYKTKIDGLDITPFGTH